MKLRKILSLSLTACTICGVLGLSSTPAYANTLNTKNNENNENIIISPRVAGIFTVTARSGANIRSEAGTNHSIVSSARWGAKLDYCGRVAEDSSGVTWYKVISENGTKGWISSKVGWLG